MRTATNRDKLLMALALNAYGRELEQNEQAPEDIARVYHLADLVSRELAAVMIHQRGAR